MKKALSQPNRGMLGRRLQLEVLETRRMLTGEGTLVFQDDFSTDTSADYTSTALWARPGSALPTMDISTGALTLSGVGQTGAVTQAITFHNSETLSVGETFLLDVDLAGGVFGDSHEMIGLAVSAGIMDGVDPFPPAANADVRDDEYSFIYGGFRFVGAGDDYRSGGYVAVDMGLIAGGEEISDESAITGGDLSTIASLYIERTEVTTYEIGWIDSGDTAHLVRTVDTDLGSAPSIGIFTDMRDQSGGGESLFSQTVDNLRIVHEEPLPSGYPENPVRFPRQVEDLDRGVIAVRKSSSEVFVSWRLLGNEPSDTAFDLYRSANGGAPIRLHLDPLTAGTNFTDTTANPNVDNTYFIRAIVDGVAQEPSVSYTLAASSPVRQFLTIPLQTPPNGVTPIGNAYSYEANDASAGDLDGDGDYEVILKWEPSNKSNYQGGGYTGNTYVDAYTLEGQMLWRIDLGINVRSGSQTTQFLVYDFDGDGRSEVVLRTAPGTVDGLGNDVILPGDDPNADYRETTGFMEGTVISGPEYLTVFDGLTGAELATTMFPLERISLESWGDNYANRSDRYMATVAYLDGVRPSMVWTRGMYGPAAGYTARNELVAFDWRDGQLTQGWRFNAATNGANNEFVGEGAQSLSVADVDGDGFDEIIYGAAVVDHDGTLLYATELGHGDALHVSDMVPSRPGLEVFMPHESASTNGNVGASLRDAMTGEIIFSSYGTGDVGRGVAADVDPSSPGYEVWSVYDEVLYGSDGSVLGTMPFEAQAALYNYAIWWDGDLTRELLNGETIYNYDGPGYSTILSAWQQGAENTNDGKRTPALQADLFGDWREEVIWRTADNTSLQVWTTTIPTNERFYTLMHDTQYREAIAWQNVGYNQPPHPSFFLGAGMEAPPTPQIYFGGELAGDYNQDGAVNAADYTVWRDAEATQNLIADGDHNGVVDGGDYDVWFNNYGAVAEATAMSAGTITPSASLAIENAWQPSEIAPSEAQVAVSSTYPPLTLLTLAEGETEGVASLASQGAARPGVQDDLLLLHLISEIAEYESRDSEEEDIGARETAEEEHWRVTKLAFEEYLVSSSEPS